MRWALLWALLIFILCAIPGKDIPFGDIWDLFNLDKFIHASIFFMQAILLINGFSNQSGILLFNTYPKSFTLFICIIYGGDLELMQGAFFEDRNADVYDFAANTIGALAGIALYPSIIRIYKRFRP